VQLSILNTIRVTTFDLAVSLACVVTMIGDDCFTGECATLRITVSADSEPAAVEALRAAVSHFIVAAR
jgi:hypothetical protein